MAYSGRSFVPEAKVVKSVVGKFRDDSKFDVAVLMNWSELLFMHEPVRTLTPGCTGNFGGI